MHLQEVDDPLKLQLREEDNSLKLSVHQEQSCLTSIQEDIEDLEEQVIKFRSL